VTGALATPLALAVTWAMPTLVGLQICPKLSQRPAQATPGAVETKLRTLGLLEVKVTGTETVPPVRLTTFAVNDRTAPKSRLLPVGVSVTLEGVGRLEVVLLLPPHPTIPPKKKNKNRAANRQEANRRMHPPRPKGRAARSRRVSVYAGKPSV
jgi:hypothetical protein